MHVAPLYTTLWIHVFHQMRPDHDLNLQHISPLHWYQSSELISWHCFLTNPQKYVTMLKKEKTKPPWSATGIESTLKINDFSLAPLLRPLEGNHFRNRQTDGNENISSLIGRDNYVECHSEELKPPTRPGRPSVQSVHAHRYRPLNKSEFFIKIKIIIHKEMS